MTKPFINQEQCEAHLADIQRRNPHRARIDGLYDQIAELSAQIDELTPKEERYYALLEAIAATKEHSALASLMGSQELGRHLIGLFAGRLEGAMDEAIFDEMLTRIGFDIDAELDGDE